MQIKEANLSFSFIYAQACAIPQAERKRSELEEMWYEAQVQMNERGHFYFQRD
jgi:hypothetical protein